MVANAIATVLFSALLMLSPVLGLTAKTLYLLRLFACVMIVSCGAGLAGSVFGFPWFGALAAAAAYLMIIAAATVRIESARRSK